MKAVLDTNVVVSGTFWTGSSFNILELVDRDKLTIVVTLPILKEYDKIINSKEILEKTTIYQQARIKSIYKILSKAVIVEPKEKIDIINNDPDDNKFLEAAVAGNVDYILSQDKKHLLVLKKFRNISIITPKEFLDKNNVLKRTFGTFKMKTPTEELLREVDEESWDE